VFGVSRIVKLREEARKILETWNKETLIQSTIDSMDYFQLERFCKYNKLNE
jgi:hypothetical protein